MDFVFIHRKLYNLSILKAILVETLCILAFLDSRLPEGVAIVKTPRIRVFVIPGLTRNPVLFEGIMFLDAGSSPA
jgi:hypothetical protein